MARVQLTDNSYCSEALTVFELNPDILDKYQLLAANALTCLDHDSQFTLVVENHGCQPVYLTPSLSDTRSEVGAC